MSSITVGSTASGDDDAPKEDSHPTSKRDDSGGGGDDDDDDGAGVLPELCALAQAKRIPQLVAALRSGCAPTSATCKLGRTALHYACAHPSFPDDALRALVDAGCDAGALDNLRCTPLHHAALAGAVFTMAFLLDVACRHADLTRVNVENDTPLSNAVYSRSDDAVSFLTTTAGCDLSAEVARNPAMWQHLLTLTAVPPRLLSRLVDAGADVNVVLEGNGDTALLRAAYDDNGDMALWLVRHGASVTATSPSDGCTALHHAAREGNMLLVKELMAAGADHATTQDQGATPLHFAAWKGHVDVARVLVAAGASVTVATEDGGTPAHYACMGDAVGVLRFLVVECGASVDVEAQSHTRLVHVAAENGSAHALRCLVNDCGVDDAAVVRMLSAQMEGMHSPLSLTADAHAVDAVKAVLHGLRSRGAQPSPSAMANALCAAAAHSSLDVVRVLLDGDPGAGLNSYGDGGLMPIHAAASSTHDHVRVAAVRALVDAGASVKARTSAGDCAVFCAAELGHADAIAALVSAGAEVNTRDSGGATPLCVAAQHGHLDAVKTLLEAGATVGAETNAGLEALHLACDSGHTDVVRLLVGVGADVRRRFGETSATPLHMAAWRGRMDVVTMLVADMGAEVDALTSDGGSALHYACMGGHLDVAQYLVAHGADLDRVAAVGTHCVHMAAESGCKPLLEYIVQRLGRAVCRRQKDAGATVLEMACGGGDEATALYVLSVAGTAEDDVHGDNAARTFHHAASTGMVSVVKALLEAGMDPRVVHGGGTAAHAAALHGQLDVLRYLHGHTSAGPALLHTRNGEGWTPLMTAAVKGHADVVAYLLANGCDVNAANHDGQSVLAVAAEAAEAALVATLLDAGACVDSQDASGTSVLLVAAQHGNAAMLQQLLERGADGGHVTAVGGSTLGHAAAVGGSVEVLQRVADMDATVLSATDANGDTPLMRAAAANNGSTAVRFLLDAVGVDAGAVNADGETAVHFAAQAACMDGLHMLLAAGGPAAASLANNDGFTPLHLACMRQDGSEGVVAALLDAGAEVNAASHTGRTPLMLAAEEGAVTTVAALLAAGADVGVADVEHRQALHGGVSSGKITVVRALLDAGADVHAVTQDSGTPLHYAAFTGGTHAGAIIQLLVQRGADLYAVTDDYAQPLHYAAMSGMCDAIQALVDAGSDVNCLADVELSPLQLAAREGHLPAVRLLASLGADPLHLDRDGQSATELADAAIAAEVAEVEAQRRRVMRRMPLLHVLRRVQGQVAPTMRPTSAAAKALARGSRFTDRRAAALGGVLLMRRVGRMRAGPAWELVEPYGREVVQFL